MEQCMMLAGKDVWGPHTNVSPAASHEQPAFTDIPTCMFCRSFLSCNKSPKAESLVCLPATSMQVTVCMCRRRIGDGASAGREAPALGALTQLQRRFTGDGTSEGACSPWGSRKTCLKRLCHDVAIVGVRRNGASCRNATEVLVSVYQAWRVNQSWLRPAAHSDGPRPDFMPPQPWAGVEVAEGASLDGGTPRSSRGEKRGKGEKEKKDKRKKERKRDRRCASLSTRYCACIDTW